MDQQRSDAYYVGKADAIALAQHNVYRGRACRSNGMSMANAEFAYREGYSDGLKQLREQEARVAKKKMRCNPSSPPIVIGGPRVAAFAC